jgi:hypothetical protein
MAQRRRKTASQKIPVTPEMIEVGGEALRFAIGEEIAYNETKGTFCQIAEKVIRAAITAASATPAAK